MPASTTDPTSAAETAEESAKRGNLYDQNEILHAFPRVFLNQTLSLQKKAKRVVASSYLGSVASSYLGNASDQPA